MKWKALFALIVVASLELPAARAVEPDEILSDPTLEARARAISRELRCVVCQSENIDDSNAPLAKDLRLLVRERLLAGDTDAEVIEFVVARYGEYVLLKPRVHAGTIALWAAPVIVLIAGGAILILTTRGGRNNTAEDPLSEAERRALEAMGE